MENRNINFRDSYLEVYANLNESVETDDFQEWVNQLVEEGNDLSEYTWDEMYEMYIQIDEAKLQGDDLFKQLYRGKKRKGVKTHQPGQDRFLALQNQKRSAARYAADIGRNRTPSASDYDNHGGGSRNEQVDLYDVILPHLLDEELTGDRKKRAEEKMKELRPYGRPRKATNKNYGALSRVSRAKEGSSDIFRTRETSPTKRGGRMSKGSVKAGWDGDFQADRPRNESYDSYDLVLEYLLDEGYADSVENAEVIMVNMSEEWREEILEGFKPTNYNRGGKKSEQIANQLSKLRASGKQDQATVVRFLNQKLDTPEERKYSREVSERNKRKPDARARRDAQRDEKEYRKKEKNS